MIKQKIISIALKYSKRHSRENLYKYLDDSIKIYKVKNKNTILNIGSSGELEKFIKSKNIKIYELDIDKNLKPQIIGDITSLPIKTSSCDVVFCLEVLEHVKNPFKAVEELKRVLKPYGIIIGSTPFMIPIHTSPYDYFRYTKYGIKELFKEFEILELKERNTYIKSWYVILLRTLFITSNQKGRRIAMLLMPLFISLLPLVKFLDWLIKGEESTTGYFFVLQKPG